MSTITQLPIRLDDFFSVAPDRSCGAQASFVGIVRDHDHGKAVRKLYYDCYAPMAERMMGALVEQARVQWDIHDIRVLHRVGELGIGEVAVAIAVSSSHRAEAFAACRFMIEEIKKKVPIWKKEIFEDGSREWVVCSHTEMEITS